jgi:hypothetical protein
MGGSTSKLTPSIDLSQASIPVAELQRQVREQANLAAQTASSSVWGTAKIIIYLLLGVAVLGGIISGIYYLWSIKPLENSLNITKATFGTQDYTSQIQAKVNKDALYISKGFAEISGITGGIGTGTIIYKFMDESDVRTATIPTFNEVIDISAANRDAKENFTNKRKPSSSPSGNKTGPSILGKIKNVFNYSGSSADLLPYPKDATAIATIPSSSAPLSGGQEGAYGMQFWMYIKDWNHNFGKDKFIVSRNDSTNSNIGNPEVSLHPTDNTLKISISIFPDNHQGSSKSEPAPAGHSSSTDDVFVCEIPDIPLQAWTSVSITTFSRNLDVYLNGKLVKSCLLSGVPKPASGDIILNKDGGFSGYLCSFFHYPRMLVPSDAQTFYGQGTSCTSVTDPSTSTKVTGYGFKFGIYDASGKEINQYVL